MRTQKKRLLAISSGGGHWVQLLRLRPAFEGCDVTYATVRQGYRADVSDGNFVVVGDCNRAKKLRLIISALGIFALLLRMRPDVIVSTGAAPGFLALRLGRLLGAKTIWIDSVANGEELSMSGRLVGRYADLWLTQWQHLARDGGPDFKGSVL
jgi:UDP-N-acetylglucosamine:LPS N-acetylglucosamine transferase